ncbi:MAG: AAA family ATPase [Dehalococcoidia bacterium]
MSTQVRGSTVTILFTDLVSSTELLQRAGDERAQRIFQAHHRLLTDTVAQHGGHEVKWLGDGLMVAFTSTADAVRCAIAMQQASRRPAAGEKLEIRAGLNVGDAFVDETDYFGTSVVVARRLCDRAAAGQILCSNLVTGLLSGRQAFTFNEIGTLELKGITALVPASEVVYESEQLLAILAHPPFVGREGEVARLTARLQETRARRGGLSMLAGEPGIGKTRTSEEFAENARNEGFTVLWGRCYEGEWTPPYAPFAEAIKEYAEAQRKEDLQADLGPGGGAIARLVPEIRLRVPEFDEPTDLQPDEERFRLLDAVSQLLIAAAARNPLLLVLDDLHWADKGTVTMMRHISRFAPRNRLLMLGTYRNADVGREHPLTEAMGALPRETSYEHIQLKGLSREEIAELLRQMADRDVPPALIEAIGGETNGNPFFIREVLLHLIEEGKIFRQDGRWTSNVAIEDMGIPEGVRQVIASRLARLSETANKFLAAAAAFNGPFPFGVVAAVGAIDEMDALDAIDEALEAQVLKAGSEADTYEFAHALFRHTLYGEVSPSRQVRLHRRIAESMESVYGARADQYAPELAYHYYKSAVLPGAEKGTGYAIAAADRSEEAYAWDETVDFLRMALDLMPDGDERRTDILPRLGIAQIWTNPFEDAGKTAMEASQLIAAQKGNPAAADYLEEAASALWIIGWAPFAWNLAEKGLELIGERRDLVWASLMSLDLARRDALDPDSPGIPLDSREREDVAAVMANSSTERWDRVYDQAPHQLLALAWPSRTTMLANAPQNPMLMLLWAGEYRRSEEMWLLRAQEAEQTGQIGDSVICWAQVARSRNALGDLPGSDEAFERCKELSLRFSAGAAQILYVAGARLEMVYARSEGYELITAEYEYLLQPAIEQQFAFSAIRAASAEVYASSGREDDALRWLGTTIAAIERAPGWTGNYALVTGAAARALWEMNRTDHAEVIERNIREKLVPTEFTYPMRDSRLAMGWLTALAGRHQEASAWFAKAREALDGQEAATLRAIVDYDEALMYARRGAPGDDSLALPLLQAALKQFKERGMGGWQERGRQLLVQLTS